MSALIVLNKNRSPNRTRTGSFCAFGKEDDPRIHVELCGVLDELKIPHKTVYRTDHLFNLSTTLRFRLVFPASRFEEAENAIREAFSLDSNEQIAANCLRLVFFSGQKGPNPQIAGILSPEENILAPNLQVILPIGFRKTPRRLSGQAMMHTLHG